MSSPNDGLSGATPPENKTDDKTPDVNSARPEPELPRWARKAALGTPFSETRMAAFIGPRWESSYRAKLARFEIDPAFTPTWNWAAALLCPLWFLYRKLYLAFAIFAILPQYALSLLTDSTDIAALQAATGPEAMKSPEFTQAMMMYAAITISAAIAAGGTANWLLFRRARAAATVVTVQQLPEDAALAWLNKAGGVSLIPTAIFAAVILVSIAATAMSVLPK